MSVKWCPRCKQMLEIEAFVYLKSFRTYAYCRKCMADYQRARSMSHIDKKPKNCGICDIEFGDKIIPCADHNHETGIFRDRLCPNCNKAIGFFKESPWVIRKAAEYIEKHEDDAPAVPSETQEEPKKEYTQSTLLEKILKFREDRLARESEES